MLMTANVNAGIAAGWRWGFKIISEPNEHTNKCKSTIDHEFVKLVHGWDQKTQMVLSWAFPCKVCIT